VVGGLASDLQATTSLIDICNLSFSRREVGIVLIEALKTSNSSKDPLLC